MLMAPITQVVYLPTCVTRMMGPSLSDKERASVHEKILSLFHKADYEVIYPEERHWTVTVLACISHVARMSLLATISPVHGCLHAAWTMAPHALACLQGLSSSCCGMMFKYRGF